MTKKFFLNSRKFAIRENRKIPYDNPFVFLASYANNFFALHSLYTADTLYRVWFDLDNSLTRWKRPLLKFLFHEIQKVPHENPTYFLGKLNQKNFLLYIVITLVILNTEFGLIWTTPWPDDKEIFFKFAKIRN